ncbi:MAG: hypothetical protein GYB31_15780 [Bacteroidetes bacterium]|nr:hypothetical protein [Bacteroidota bacterium]
MKVFALLFCCLFSGLLSAQASLQEVDYERIPKKKVCRLIENLQEKDGFQFFSDLTSSCCDSPEEYSYHFAEYYVDADIESVWNAYNTVAPDDAWNGKLVGFGMLYSSHDGMISYSGDPFSGLEVGQLVFINLKIVGGMINVPVVLEITNIDKSEMRMEFCYADCSTSEGTQSVQLFETEDGRTRIEHVSYFRSESKFRDKNFYPHFHTKVLDEFHGNIARLVDQ